MEITRIRVENFMNAVDTEVKFSRKTIIKARNGVGKSTIANAYMWLMFGCDMDLHDNPMVRRLENGVPVDGDISVTAEFDIDGKIVTARKVQKRTYTKDGSSYSDDNTYYVNEVPKTLKDFNAYFDCDMKALLICSNIGAFIGKKDKEMREYLFSKVENVTDYDIAARNPARGRNCFSSCLRKRKSRNSRKIACACFTLPLRARKIICSCPAAFPRKRIALLRRSHPKPSRRKRRSRFVARN